MKRAYVLFTLILITSFTAAEIIRRLGYELLSTIVLVAIIAPSFAIVVRHLHKHVS